MQDHEKLLKKFGEPIHEHTTKNDVGIFRIRHAFMITKDHFRFIDIKEKYNPYNDWDKYEAINKAKELYNRKFFNIKS